MANAFQISMRQAAYDALLKTNPQIIEALKHDLQHSTAKQIERHFVKLYGNGNLLANSTICAAYHIENNPKLMGDAE